MHFGIVKSVGTSRGLGRRTGSLEADQPEPAQRIHAEAEKGSALRLFGGCHGRQWSGFAFSHRYKPPVQGRLIPVRREKMLHPGQESLPHGRVLAQQVSKEGVDLAGDLLVKQPHIGVRKSLWPCMEILNAGVPDAGHRHDQGQFLERGVFGGFHGDRVHGLGLAKQFWLKGARYYGVIWASCCSRPGGVSLNHLDWYVSSQIDAKGQLDSVRAGHSP